MKRTGLLSICALILLIGAATCASNFKKYTLFGKTRYTDPSDH